MADTKDKTEESDQPLVPQVKENTFKRSLAIGYTSAIITVFANGSRIPLLKLLDTPQVLKLCWRQQAMVPFVILIMLWDLRGKTMKGYSKTRLIIAALIYAPYVQVYVVPPMLTSAANVMLLISTVGIITVLWRLIRCIKQTRMKFVGAFVGFAGACIMMSNAVVISGDIKPLLGDLLALFDAFLITSIYLILDPVLKAGIPSGVVSMVLTAVATIAYFIVCLFMYTFDFNPDTGIFGWLHPDHVLYVLIFVGFVNSIGNFTSYFTLKHLDLVTTQTIQLFTPIVSGGLAYILGVDDAPGILALIGGIVLLVGCFLTIRATDN